MKLNNNQEQNKVVDLETVCHVAKLIRLEIDPTQAEEFSKQFSQIIRYFQLLDHLDTENVPPANEIWHTGNVFREDEVRDSLPKEDFLKNVPNRQGDHVNIPNVFDES